LAKQLATLPQWRLGQAQRQREQEQPRQLLE